MDENWIKSLPISDVASVESVNGGAVNKAYRLRTVQKDYFLLVQPGKDESFYAAEIAGLKAFSQAGITAPHVIASGRIQQDAYLLLNYLEAGSGEQTDLSKTIAKLHTFTSENGLYGFDYDYTGTDSHFKNDWTDSWVELFVYNRLDVLAGQLNTRDFWRADDDDDYQAAREIVLESLSGRQPDPSLLHGDLWGGNHMFLQDGEPALFDPSPLYGDREFDIGISSVFGNFTPDFYKSYQDTYPLEKGYQKRLSFYRLYLLMVHAVKFGHAYYDGTKMMLAEILSQ